MRYAALATDYDGTLASQGRVNAATVEALHAFRSTGRRLILVTGRELDELLGIFPEIGVFDRVVAENGALLYCPHSGDHRVLGDPPPLSFVRELERRGVAPLSVGRSIVATVTPHETTVFETVRDLGLELQVIFNKGAVMVLPAGVNKATGLTAALDDLKLSIRNVVAIGDAENDHAMLRASEFGVAVANALPALKQEADYASAGTHADAVIEAMMAMAQDDMAHFAERAGRRRMALGALRDGAAVTLPVAGHALLVSGPTADEATGFVASLLERLRDEGYQCCTVDPRGRYAGERGAVSLGAAGGAATTAKEISAALEDSPTTSVVIGFSGATTEERSLLLAELPGAMVALRARLGRPHTIVVDACEQADVLLPLLHGLTGHLDGIGLVVACTDASILTSAVGTAFDTVVTLGLGAELRMQEVLGILRAGKSPMLTGDRLAPGEALIWSAALGDGLLAFRPLTPNAG